MKKNLHLTNRLAILALVVVFVMKGSSLHAQTYTTKANGAWSSASTWVGGTIPDATNIPSTAIINIQHSITYSGADIKNNGTINIYNAAGLTPRLVVAGGVNVTNKLGANFFLTGGEFRQYRFTGGGEIGISQSGAFTNDGGTVRVKNSFVEVAQDWTNQGSGVSVFRNASLAIGRNYSLKSSAIDTLEYSSVSVGFQGSGDFTEDGASAYFYALRVEVASLSGKFSINNMLVNGDIDYISLKNHLTGIYSSDKITVANGATTTGGLNLDAYCIANASNYQPNGKFTGTQTSNCSLNDFPAKLFGGGITPSLNFSSNPVLIAGTNLALGAQYKYESVIPGVDAIVRIDSLVNGATVSMLDDNTAGSGFTEGFQPQIISGSVVGKSYAVFTFSYKFSGTNLDYKLDTFKLTAVDIDGTSNLKEFDQIALGAGATADYIAANPAITLTQVQSGTFMGINADANTVNGIDTSAKAYMFTVKNTGVSSYTLTLGLSNTVAQSTLRLFSVYMKGFNYPAPITLPVKLESFNATLAGSGKSVNLSWTTASEMNLSNFVVERSTDGINFQQAGLVFANGTAANKTSYVFPDNITDIRSVIIYYRLRSVDNDGKSEYSATRVIRIGQAVTNTISITAYPNPVTSDLRITVPDSWQNKRVIYEVLNMNGQTVKRTETSSSSQTETMHVSSMAPGLYIVKVSAEGQSVQQKVIKQ